MKVTQADEVAAAQLYPERPKLLGTRRIWVVKFGACQSAIEIPATQVKLNKDLRVSLGARRVTDVMNREVPAEDAQETLSEIAAAGGHKPWVMPGNAPALLDFLNHHRYGWLVMASAWAQI